MYAAAIVTSLISVLLLAILVLSAFLLVITCTSRARRMRCISREAHAAKTTLTSDHPERFSQDLENGSTSSSEDVKDRTTTLQSANCDASCIWEIQNGLLYKDRISKTKDNVPLPAQCIISTC